METQLPVATREEHSGPVEDQDEVSDSSTLDSFPDMEEPEFSSTLQKFVRVKKATLESVLVPSTPLITGHAFEGSVRYSSNTNHDVVTSVGEMRPREEKVIRLGNGECLLVSSHQYESYPARPRTCGELHHRKLALRSRVVNDKLPEKTKAEQEEEKKRKAEEEKARQEELEKNETAEEKKQRLKKEKEQAAIKAKKGRRSLAQHKATIKQATVGFGTSSQVPVGPFRAGMNWAQRVVGLGKDGLYLSRVEFVDSHISNNLLFRSIKSKPGNVVDSEDGPGSDNILGFRDSRRVHWIRFIDGFQKREWKTLVLSMCDEWYATKKQQLAELKRRRDTQAMQIVAGDMAPPYAVSEFQRQLRAFVQLHGEKAKSSPIFRYFAQDHVAALPHFANVVQFVKEFQNVTGFPPLGPEADAGASGSDGWLFKESNLDCTTFKLPVATSVEEQSAMELEEEETHEARSKRVSRLRLRWCLKLIVLVQCAMDHHKTIQPQQGDSNELDCATSELGFSTRIAVQVKELRARPAYFGRNREGEATVEVLLALMQYCDPLTNIHLTSSAIDSISGTAVDYVQRAVSLLEETQNDDATVRAIFYEVLGWQRVLNEEEEPKEEELTTEGVDGGQEASVASLKFNGYRTYGSVPTRALGSLFPDQVAHTKTRSHFPPTMCRKSFEADLLPSAGNTGSLQKAEGDPLTVQFVETIVPKRHS